MIIINYHELQLGFKPREDQISSLKFFSLMVQLGSLALRHIRSLAIRLWFRLLTSDFLNISNVVGECSLISERIFRINL